MNLLLAILGLTVTLGGWAYWVLLIRQVRIAERRWAMNVAQGIALALALGALAGGGGLAVAVMSGTTLVAGAAFFGLLALAPQSNQPPAVTVGSPLPEFTAPDHNGEPFALASLAGRPVLLKFFRGHW